jgi:hypothetical protein
MALSGRPWPHLPRRGSASAPSRRGALPRGTLACPVPGARRGPPARRGGAPARLCPRRGFPRPDPLGRRHTRACPRRGVRDALPRLWRGPAPARSPSFTSAPAPSLPTQWCTRSRLPRPWRGQPARWPDAACLRGGPARPAQPRHGSRRPRATSAARAAPAQPLAPLRIAQDWFVVRWIVATRDTIVSNRERVHIQCVCIADTSDPVLIVITS